MTWDSVAEGVLVLGSSAVLAAGWKISDECNTSWGASAGGLSGKC